MSERLISFETLNAYMDGELDTAAAAEVARALAESPALARELAALSRLRSAVAESIEVPPLSVPAPPPTTSHGIAVAAGIALVVFIAGSILMTRFTHDPGIDWLARVWQIHHGWSVNAVSSQGRSTVQLAQRIEAMPQAYVPDLSASRLSLVHAAVVPFTANRQALLAGYRGSRGCKISLLIFPSPDALGDALSPFRDGHNEAYGWRVGGLAYVILSDGMDSARFRLLAESVRNTSKQHLPFDTQTRLALRKSRDQSAPCIA